MSSFKSACLLFALSLSSGLVKAQAGGEWALILSASQDEESYESLFASFNLAIGDETWLSLTGGSSRAPLTEQSVRASLFEIGIDHDFGPLGLGLSAERWGDTDNLESSDLRAEIFFRRDRFRLALVHETRDLDIFF